MLIQKYVLQSNIALVQEGKKPFKCEDLENKEGERREIQGKLKNF